MKRLGRKLTLSTETIRDLNDLQLRKAAGGQTQQGGRCMDTDGCNPNSISQTSCLCQTGNGCVTDGCCG